MGKPHTEENAKNMLKSISGNFIDFLTGMAVIDIDNKKEIQDYEITKVKMKKMSEKEIDDYIKSEKPLDNAGAFNIHARGAILVEKVDGCYYNIVGLPLFKLNSILNRLGISIFEYDRNL